MQRFFKLFTPLHVKLYQLTNGRIGAYINGGDILLLTTIGRRSGKIRTAPLMYLQDGNSYMISGGAAGATHHPGWYWNATRGPHPVTIHVRNKIMPVSVKEMSGSQRDEFYGRFLALHEHVADFYQQSNRTVPVLLLTPIAQS